jgi:F-type H+-transporting ATPase subunit b
VQLDWTTFLLEVINFLILVWLLKRFLYRPVLNVIEKRRQRIEAELAQAARRQEEAQTLQHQYESRLADWEVEKRTALEVLEQEIATERGKRLEQLNAEQAQQRLKQQAQDEQMRTQWRGQAEAEALQLGSAFASRLLSGLAGSELDGRLQQLFLEQLRDLPEALLARLQEGWRDGADVEVVSATVLDAAAQEAIRQALIQRLGEGDGPWRFRQDEQLIAGLRVSIGGWILQANLQDELRFFTEAANRG